MPVKLEQLRTSAQVRVGWRTNIAPEWDFDVAAIEEAGRALGLEWAIEVGCAEYPRGRWGGMHSCERDRDGWKHRIRVRRAHTPEQASRTLWHELAHAMQNERDGVHQFRGTRLEESLTYPKSAYRERPTEVEARSWEGCARYEPLVH